MYLFKAISFHSNCYLLIFNIDKHLFIKFSNYNNIVQAHKIPTISSYMPNSLFMFDVSILDNSRSKILRPHRLHRYKYHIYRVSWLVFAPIIRFGGSAERAIGAWPRDTSAPIVRSHERHASRPQRIVISLMRSV